MDTIYTMVARIVAGIYERDENEDVGAGMVEYALLVALIGVLLIGSLTALRGGIANTFSNAVSALGGGG